MEVNEENQKKVPRARKANFSMLEESILQREVENNFDVLRDKHRRQKGKVLCPTAFWVIT
jgi:L-lysine 2,3-aminomutase